MKVVLKRPIFITIPCICSFIAMAYSVLSVFDPEIKRMGEWFPALFGFIVAARFMAVVGVWHMKRWGLELYIISFFARLSFFMFTGTLEGITTIMGIVFHFIWMIVFMIYYKRMDFNL